MESVHGAGLVTPDGNCSRRSDEIAVILTAPGPAPPFPPRYAHRGAMNDHEKPVTETSTMLPPAFAFEPVTCAKVVGL
jgi:hypothetical protein